MTPPNHISGEIVRRRSKPGQWRIGSPALARGRQVRNLPTLKVAPRAGIPENAPAKAVGVDCGARFLATHPVTNPVVDPISDGWCFDDPVFVMDLTFTLAGDMDCNVTPRQDQIPPIQHCWALDNNCFTHP
jgi:hypothetical protein